jgi:hypothetical protein
MRQAPRQESGLCCSVLLWEYCWSWYAALAPSQVAWVSAWLLAAVEPAPIQQFNGLCVRLFQMSDFPYNLGQFEHVQTHGPVIRAPSG